MTATGKFVVESAVELDFKDVLICPSKSALTSRKDVRLNCELSFKHTSATWTGVPIIAANMDTVGTPEMAISLAQFDCVTALHKFVQPEEVQYLSTLPDRFMVSTGISASDLSQLRKFGAPKMICVDVANGYMEAVEGSISRLRDEFPKSIISCGNVVTGDRTEELIEAGADIIKIGIGSGSVCTTRLKTGIGRPQLSAVLECAIVAREIGGHIISDGGATVAGDLAKAFGAGASFVMLGSMLSGHQECAGELIEENGRQYKLFYGMSSDTAMNKHYGGHAHYRSSEGKTVKVPYKGHVRSTVMDILGGIRSTCTYVGAANIAELYERTKFFRVNAQVNTVFN